MSYEAQAAHAPLPGAPLATITVPNGSASTTADLSAALGKWVALKADVKTRIRGGIAGVAAVVTDYPLTADMPEQFKVTAARTHLSAFGDGAAGQLVVVVVDE